MMGEDKAPKEAARSKTPGPSANHVAPPSERVPCHRLVVVPELSEVARVRRSARDIASTHGFSTDRVFDISLCVSEATANAIEHVNDGRPVTVTFSVTEDSLEVQVAASGEFSLPDPGRGLGQRGLGLPLMAKLADRLTLASSNDGGPGTAVILSFRREGPSMPPTPAPRTIGLESAIATNYRLVAQAKAQLAKIGKLLDDRPKEPAAPPGGVTQSPKRC